MIDRAPAGRPLVVSVATTSPFTSVAEELPIAAPSTTKVTTPPGVPLPGATAAIAAAGRNVLPIVRPLKAHHCPAPYAHAIIVTMGDSSGNGVSYVPDTNLTRADASLPWCDAADAFQWSRSFPPPDLAK